MSRADKLRQTLVEPGNDVDPLMGTCLSLVTSQSIRDVRLFVRTKDAYQDGADFYDRTRPRNTHTGEEGTALFVSYPIIARYEWPFVHRNDWYSLEAAEEAAAMFLRDNPDYRLIDVNVEKE